MCVDDSQLYQKYSANTIQYYNNCQFKWIINTSVGLKPKIPKEPQFLYFGTENFEQCRFQSI